MSTLVRFNQEFDRLLASDNYKTIKELESFDSTLEIFSTNYDELVDALVKFADIEHAYPIMGITMREERRLYMKEVTRRLYNFVSAAKTLVDHTTKFMKGRYEGSPLFTEYQNEVQRRFTNNGQTQFIQGLRNIMTHRRIPPIGIRHTITTNPSSTTDTTYNIANTTYIRKSAILTDKEQLNQQAKQFLNSQSEEINLLNIAQNHYHQTIEFYDWLRTRLQQHHSEEFRLFSEAQHELFTKFSASLLEQIRSNIQALKQGEGEFSTLLYEVLPSHDYHTLRNIESQPPAWIEEAITAVERNLPLPTDIKDSLRKLAKGATTP